ncbi:MAG: DUF1365 domain-containing protein [Roseibacillus sp.]
MTALRPPRLYQCEVMHQRLVPKREPFHYRVFMLAFELNDLPQMAKGNVWLGHNRFHLFSINDRDHIDLGEEGGIRPNLLKWLYEQGQDVPQDARIELVTFPSVLGYGFNPVSFYAVSRSTGEPLLMVAEVVNTFREMKLFLVDEEGSDQRWQRRVEKGFYVSPFSDSGDDFDFRLSLPREKLAINIDNWHDGERTLVSAVRGQELPLTASRLFWFALRYPFLSLKIIVGIHWQAARLWFAKIPYFKKSERLEIQRDVLRPHSSPEKRTP